MLIFLSLKAAISQTREKLSATVGEVTWRGKTVPVKTEKARAFILRSQTKEDEITRCVTSDEKLEFYDNFLMDCKEASQAVKEDLNYEAVSLPFGEFVLKYDYTGHCTLLIS